jgi:hypothetical protein
MSVEIISAALSDVFVKTVYKPLELRAVVNNFFKATGVEDNDGETKELPGPMFYTYCKKGYIKSTSKAGKRGGVTYEISQADAIEWFAKYAIANGYIEVPDVEIDDEMVEELENADIEH